MTEDWRLEAGCGKLEAGAWDWEPGKHNLGLWEAITLNPARRAQTAPLRPLGTRKDERRGSWMEFELSRAEPGKVTEGHAQRTH